MRKSKLINTQSQFDNLKNIEEYLLEIEKINEYRFLSSGNHVIMERILPKFIASYLAIYNCDKDMDAFKEYFYNNHKIQYLETCLRCQNQVEFIIDSKSKTITEIDISCEPVTEIVLTVNFPSGKLFIGDYLRLSQDIFESFDGDENINYIHGQIEKSRQYALSDVVHLFIGGDGIQLNEITSNTLSFVHDDCSGLPIYGDLRWLTIVDLETVDNQLKTQFKNDYEVLKNELELVINNLDSGSLIINVIPGEYQVTYRPYEQTANLIKI